MKVKKVSLKEAFLILDGRMATNMEDICEILNFIFSKNYTTIAIPAATWDKLIEINPPWIQKGKDFINDIKKEHETDNFWELMEIIDKEYPSYKIEIEKIKN